MSFRQHMHSTLDRNFFPPQQEKHTNLLSSLSRSIHLLTPQKASLPPKERNIFKQGTTGIYTYTPSFLPSGLLYTLLQSQTSYHSLTWILTSSTKSLPFFYYPTPTNEVNQEKPSLTTSIQTITSSRQINNITLKSKSFQ